MIEVGYPHGSEEPVHGLLIHDLMWLAECTLATVQDLEMKSRPSKRELERQRSLAKFGVSSAIYHGGIHKKIRKDTWGRCPFGRVSEVLERYEKTGEIIMHWELEEGE